MRRGAHQALLAKGGRRRRGTRDLWLWHPDELSGTKLEAFAAVAGQNRRTARACYHRLMFLGFWEQPDVPAAQRFFAPWLAEALRRGLEPIKKVARTLRDHLHGLLSCFRHRLTKALCEAFNSSLQALKATARGFRNFEPYRTRLLFFRGKLSLHPL